MARSFASASSQYLSSNSLWTTPYPITMACFFYPFSDTTNQCLISVANSSVSESLSLEIGSSSTDAVVARSRKTSLEGAALVSGRVTTYAWNHAGAVFTNTSVRSVTVNGFSAANGTVVAATSFDLSLIGATKTTTYGLYFGGYIAEVAIWAAALTNAEIIGLGKGQSPLQTRVDSLIAYHPFGSFYGKTDKDVCNSDFVLTENNSPTWADHCRIVHKPDLQIPSKLPAAPIAKPVLFHSYYMSQGMRP